MDSNEQACPGQPVSGQPNSGEQQSGTPPPSQEEQRSSEAAAWDSANLLAGALQGMLVSDAPRASTQTCLPPAVAQLQRALSQNLHTSEQEQEDDRLRSQIHFPLHGVPNLAGYPPPSGSLGSTDSAYQMQQQMQQANRLMAVLQPTGGAQVAVPRPANDFTQLQAMGQVQMLPAAGYTRIGYQQPQSVQPTALVRPVTQTGYVSPPPSLQYASSSATTLPFSTSNSSLPRSQRNSQRLRQQGGRASGEGGSSGTLPDVTVEDLLRMVLALQPNERTIDAVGQGLHCLDSSATAALLKELSKQGQVKRAFEIFDWLRQLPPTHALASLCDLYTYTTMIAQCGSAAQLRKALELVAEMRARSITCNVHTYSALMNVCMKANELDVALDVFKQMQDAGLVPNLVTYNILIDVHVKKGMWDEAIRALDAIQQQGIQAEARTYNTVISACSKAGHFDRALRVYQHMHDAGVEPSTTTYTAVIGVYGRIGQLDKCLDVYHEMVKHGCERNVITYSSLISACEKVAQWQVALELYDIMRREGCRPNTVTFNSLIAACAHGNKWEKAGELFDQMAGCGCKPDAVTYTVLIGTYEKCQQWQTAVAAWEMMTANGFHPDAAVYYSLLEVLWSSGIVLAQARALQLWAAANRSGQLRVYTNVNSTTRALQYSMVTPKPGVAACTVLCWLLELRNKLLKDESSSTQPYSVVVTLQRTRTTRSDSTPSMAAHEAVRCLLLGASSPLQVVLQPASTLLTASSKDLIEWLGSTSFAELTYILQVASVQQWSVKAIAQEVGGTSNRCAEAFAAVRKLEAKQGVCSAPYNPQQRPQIVGMALQYSQSIGLAEEAAYDGLALFDRVLAANGGAGAAAARWPLCLVCCLVLCARHGAAAPIPGQQTQLPWQSHEGVQAATGFSVEELVSMERNIIVWLNGDLTIISPLRVLLLYQESLGFFAPEFRPADRTTGDLSALLSRTASSPAWLSVRPSLLAAGLLAALRNIKGILPVWPYTLQALTGLALEGGELPACIAQVEAVLQ